MISDSVLRGQAKAAGNNSVCLSGTQMILFLDAKEALELMVRDCSDDEVDWPALVRANAVLRAFIKEAGGK